MVALTLTNYWVGSQCFL